MAVPPRKHRKVPQKGDQSFNACPSTADLLLFDGGDKKLWRLTDMRAAAIERHLKTCSKCRERTKAVVANFQKVMTKIISGAR